jgi:hypothetical protein
VARTKREKHVVVTQLCGLFPKLATSKWSITSPKDDNYKCIAWAACYTDRHWWPSSGTRNPYWPPGATVDESVEAFIEAFATRGYSRCPTSEFEFGYQKVAIYATNDGHVQHMARQHFFGYGWLSKCGSLEDIIHAELESIEGDPSPYIAAFTGSYGVVVAILRRHWILSVMHGCIFRSTWAALCFWLGRRIG